MEPPPISLLGASLDRDSVPLSWKKKYSEVGIRTKEYVKSAMEMADGLQRRRWMALPPRVVWRTFRRPA